MPSYVVKWRIPGDGSAFRFEPKGCRSSALSCFWRTVQAEAKRREEGRLAMLELKVCGPDGRDVIRIEFPDELGAKRR